MPRAWYAYNGGTPVTAAGSWNRLPSSQTPSFECVGTAQLCTIYAYYPGVTAPAPNPIAPLSPNIRAYINLALTTSSNVIPQAFGKPYLYKKS